MISNADMMETLVDWQETTAALLKAVDSRNYAKFNQAFSRGYKHFRTIRLFIEQKPDISPHEKEKLLQTAKDWQDTTDSIDVWKEEIRQELADVKQTRKAKSKIRNAYHFKKPVVGLNVVRKAR